MNERTLEQQLLQLEIAADACRTIPESPRSAEINNILSIIRVALDHVRIGQDEDTLAFVRETIAEVTPRINRLVRDENDWGKHNFLKHELEEADTDPSLKFP